MIGQSPETEQIEPELQLDTSDEMMESQLNPEAKEFVPVSPQHRSPVSPPLFENGVNPLLTGIDDIVAQSPRKGEVSNLENITIPSERDFDIEIHARPHEFEQEVEQNGHENRPESAGEDSELNLKESMQKDDKLDFEYKDEKQLEESEISSTKADFGDDTFEPDLQKLDDQFGMKLEDSMNRSFYEGRDDDILVPTQTESSDILNTVQILPQDDEIMECEERKETVVEAVKEVMSEVSDLLGDVNEAVQSGQNFIAETIQTVVETQFVQEVQDVVMEKVEETSNLMDDFLMESAPTPQEPLVEPVIESKLEELVEYIPEVSQPEPVLQEAVQSPPPTPVSEQEPIPEKAKSPLPEQIVEKLVEEIQELKVEEQQPPVENNVVGDILIAGAASVVAAAAISAVIPEEKKKPAVKDVSFINFYIMHFISINFLNFPG